MSYIQFRILRIDDLWKYEVVKFVHSTTYNRNPNSFRCYFLKSTEHLNRPTRQSTENAHLNIPRYYRTNKLRKCFNCQEMKV